MKYPPPLESEARPATPEQRPIPLWATLLVITLLLGPPLTAFAGIMLIIQQSHLDADYRQLPEPTAEQAATIPANYAGRVRDPICGTGPSQTQCRDIVIRVHQADSHAARAALTRIGQNYGATTYSAKAIQFAAPTEMVALLDRLAVSDPETLSPDYRQLHAVAYETAQPSVWLGDTLGIAVTVKGWRENDLRLRLGVMPIIVGLVILLAGMWFTWTAPR